MSKSIASKVLAIAKKKEAERLKPIKEEFIGIMRKEFEKRIKCCEPWSGTYTYEKRTFNDINCYDLVVVGQELGFVILYGVKIKISIPEWTKGQKRTQAQLMVYQSNMEIKRIIKKRKESARIMCNKLLDKLERGEFEINHISGIIYELKVKVFDLDNSKEFEEEAVRILKKKKIDLYVIDPDTGIVVVRIYDE